MFELTPYRHIHPPHLDGALRSTKREFVLEELPEHRTRLIGRKWYQLNIKPLGDWSIWSGGIIHRIHQRVLDHLRTTANEAARNGPPTKASSMSQS